MKSWLILPRDALIFRDGRPFHAVPGARAYSLPFPYPSTVIGAIRTRAGTNGHGEFDTSRIPELRQKRLVGPFLVEVDLLGDIRTRFFPAPLDALLLQAEEPDHLLRLWLRPLKVPSGVYANMPEGLHPVGPHRDIKEKPARHAPAYWNETIFMEWLKQPPEEDTIAIHHVGIPELPTETRVHVHINSSTKTAQEGFLFQTSGRRFMHRVSDKTVVSRLYGLLVWTDAEIPSGPGFLGGERRAVYWEPVNAQIPPLPTEIEESIRTHRAVRLVLLTPAYFERGYLPTWLTKGIAGVRVQVAAVAMPRRPVAISGWDMEQKGEKPSRLLVPAGTVYYLRLQGDDEALMNFAHQIWFSPVSDDEQLRRDGFGLAVLGTWRGDFASWEVK